MCKLIDHVAHHVAIGMIIAESGNWDVLGSSAHPTAGLGCNTTRRASVHIEGFVQKSWEFTHGREDNACLRVYRSSWEMRARRGWIIEEVGQWTRSWHRVSVALRMDELHV